MFTSLLIGSSLIAGSVASLAGFGIGSFVTPVLAVKTGFALAVAAVSIIHFFGTLTRFFLLRKHINRKVLLAFGLTSAAGGLVGALFHSVLFNDTLTIVFACLLIFTGVSGFTGLSEKLHFKGTVAWIAGALSGFFGGLVGNQGGIRSATLFGFHLDKQQFVATATGVALMVDIVRMPVYIATQGNALLAIWPLILIGTLAVLVGTCVGGWLLKKIPAALFKKIVCGIIFLTGIFVLIQR